MPWNGKQWVCPACESPIPWDRLRILTKPPLYADRLDDVLRCCWCHFEFSPSDNAVVLQR